MSAVRHTTSLTDLSKRAKKYTLSVQIKKIGNKFRELVIIQLMGKISGLDQMYLKEDIMKIMSGKQHTVFIFDMNVCDYISSEVIGYFVSLHNLCEKTDNQFHIVGINQKFNKIIHSVGLQEIISVKDSEQSVLDSLT